MTHPWPADKVKRWPIAKLIYNARNARTHSDEQVAQIAASIEEWGWTIPILIDEAGGIIAGHGRVMAAHRLGLKDVPVMIAAGWSDAKKRAYMLADNKLTLNSDWDLDKLANEIADLRGSDFDISLIGFNESEIDDLLVIDGAQDDPDEAPEPPAIPVTDLGDVWLLGRHRLVCGDCTDPLVVDKALGGVKPHLMVTDPPYGVEYDAVWRNDAVKARRSNGKAGKHHGAPGGRSIGKITNDDRADWREAWALFPGDVAYVWHESMFGGIVGEGLEAVGLSLRSQVVWVKNNFAIGRGDYHWKHETCLYAVRNNSYWNGDRTQSTVWEIDKPQKSETGHSAQKPIECMKRPIENNSSRGQAVYDPFVGSGTTIIAAEMTGRACHAIELHPPYVDVSVLRWQSFIGKEARLEATGETFQETLEDRRDCAIAKQRLAEIEKNPGKLVKPDGSAMSAMKTMRASKAKAGDSPPS